jgi:single-strand DNA-binding protein
MNNWSFTGNLGHSAETKFVGESSVTEFNVAVKSGYGNKASTTWAKCAMWGDRGEKVAEFLKKGQLVGITGELALREYTKKDGTNGASLEVRVTDMTLLGKRDDAPAQEYETKQENKPGANVPASDYDDSIPF